MNLARIRKALFAGGAAAGGAFLLGLKTEVPQTQDGWVALIAGSLVIGATTALGTWRIRNEGTVNGSDPVIPVPRPETRPQPFFDDDIHNGPLSRGDRRG